MANAREIKLRIKGINETKKITKAMKLISASKLKKGDVVVLTGELGSGKTKFVEGFLSYFGLQDEISSPTFTIVNEYDYKDFPIFHFDVYRLEDSSEFYEIGGEEYFEKGICLIEWGELIQDALPKNFIHISFKKDKNNENSRILTVSYTHQNTTSK